MRTLAQIDARLAEIRTALQNPETTDLDTLQNEMNQLLQERAQRVAEAVANRVVTDEGQLAFQLGALDSLGVVVHEELVAAVVGGGRRRGQTDDDLNHVVVVHQTLFDRDVIRLVEVVASHFEVVAGDGVDGVVVGGIHLAFANFVGQTPEIDQNLLGSIGRAIEDSVFNVADDGVAEQTERRSGAGHAGDVKRRTIQGEGQRLTEFLHGQDGLVDVLARRLLVRSQRVEVGVQGHREDGRALNGVAVFGVLVLFRVVLCQADAVELAGEEHFHLGGVLSDIGQNAAGRLIEVLVFRQRIAVPVRVLLIDDFLVLLEGDHLVGTIRNGGIGGSTVAVGVNTILILFALLVQILVDQGHAQVVLELEALQRLVQNEDEAVVVQRLHADFVKGHCVVDLANEQELFPFLIGVVALSGGVGFRALVVVQHSGDLLERLHHVRVDLNVAVGALAALQRVVEVFREVARAAVVGQAVGRPHVAVGQGQGNIGAIVGVEAVLTHGEVGIRQILRVVGVQQAAVRIHAGLGIRFRVVNDRRASVEGVGAVVLRLRVQLLHHRVEHICGGDGRAVFPLQVVAQGVLPRTGSRALGDAPLVANIVSGNVLRIAHDHAGLHGIGVHRVVIVKLKERIRDVGQHSGVFRFSLVLVRIPVGGEGRQTAVVGVRRFFRGFSHRANAEEHARSQNQREKLLHGQTPP